MYYIVYKTVNTVNGKYYIGSHQAEKLDDGYLGSGVILKKAIRKHGRDSFRREIICLCTSFEVMRDVETHMVRYCIDNDKRHCYNIAYSGTGAAYGERNSFYGKKHTDETKRKISEIAKKRTGSLNHFYGKKHTKETKRKISENRPNNDTCMAMRRYYINKCTRWYCTPMGCFFSQRYASKETGINRNSIKNWCMNPDKFVNSNYQIPEKYWGRTWRENGFYYVDVDKVTVGD